jgi:hypothetical protein
MSRIVYFQPLNKCGEVRLDLDSCPWRSLVVFWQPIEETGFPEPGEIKSVFYKTSGDQWIEHLVEWDPWEGDDPIDHYLEVHALWVADCLAEADMVLPPELAAWRKRADEVDKEATIRPRRSPWLIRVSSRRTGYESRNGISETSASPDEDDLGKFIYERFDAGDPLKVIATQVEGRSTRRSKGWNEDRVRKELNRYCDRHKIQRPMRKQRRNRQD